MAVFINEECISCDACATECPNTAIYPGGEPYTLAEGTNSSDEEEKDAISADTYYVVSDKCTQCVGFNEEPACMAVCPTEAIALDPNKEESEEALQEKYNQLHG
jgi:ferredoxin